MNIHRNDSGRLQYQTIKNHQRLLIWRLPGCGKDPYKYRVWKNYIAHSAQKENQIVKGKIKKPTNASCHVLSPRKHTKKDRIQ